MQHSAWFQVRHAYIYKLICMYNYNILCLYLHLRQTRLVEIFRLPWVASAVIRFFCAQCLPCRLAIYLATSVSVVFCCSSNTWKTSERMTLLLLFGGCCDLRSSFDISKLTISSSAPWHLHFWHLSSVCPRDCWDWDCDHWPILNLAFLASWSFCQLYIILENCKKKTDWSWPRQIHHQTST